jgi:hypothetical protein
MSRRSILTLAITIALATIGCHHLTTAVGDESCGGFGDWSTSPYVLPFPTGAGYLVDQANCSPPGNGHRGVARYGYDFLMPIGTRVTAARAGVVVHMEESHVDGDVAFTGSDNYQNQSRRSCAPVAIGVWAGVAAPS